MAVVAVDTWADRRRRTGELLLAQPFAAEILDLYGALLPVQERAHDGARTAHPAAGDVPSYVAELVVPMVADVTMAAGPDRLRAACAELVATEDPRDLVVQWLAGEEQPPAARYLARASLSPVMEALKGDDAEESPAGRQCPHCTGLPQLSYSIPGPEDLATGRRFLQCARCLSSWGYPRMTCPGCGEDDSHKLPIFSEEGTASGEYGSVVRGLPGENGKERAHALFPHMRIDACQTCMRYVLSVDLARDPRAVPFVDEMAALPLDLYAKEQGFSKITPNLMGF